MAKRPRPYRIGPKSSVIDRIGVGWLDPETHARMMEVMLQPHDIPALYERWREKTETYERAWRRRNHLVARIKIDMDVFLAWCATRAFQPNGNALEIYVSERTTGRA